MRFLVKLIPGLLWVGLLALLSVMVARYLQFSETLVAIFLGFVIGNLWRQAGQLTAGVQWSECQGLSIAVALLGAQLNAAILMQLNGTTLIFMATSLMFTFVVTWLLAKLWRMNSSQACLLASGQGICGSAAVMATQQIVKAPAAQVGLTVGLVNFLGFLGIFVTTAMVQNDAFIDPASAGLLIGNTLQSMGHVVAAGFSVGDDVGHAAVLIKMCRILFLIPVLLVLIVVVNRGKEWSKPTGKSQSAKVHWLNLVPIFIWVFVLLSFISSMGWIPQAVQTTLAYLSDALFVMAMVAIGLNIKIKEIWQQGGQLLLMGGLVFVLQIAFTTAFLLYF